MLLHFPWFFLGPWVCFLQFSLVLPSFLHSLPRLNGLDRAVCHFSVPPPICHKHARVLQFYLRSINYHVSFSPCSLSVVVTHYVYPVDPCGGYARPRNRPNPWKDHLFAVFSLVAELCAQLKRHNRCEAGSGNGKAKEKKGKGKERKREKKGTFEPYLFLNVLCTYMHMHFYFYVIGLVEEPKMAYMLRSGLGTKCYIPIFKQIYANIICSIYIYNIYLYLCLFFKTYKSR